VTALEILGRSPIDYPIQPKEHGIDFLLDNRHLWIRSPRQAAILKIRHEIEQGIHDFFYDRGFVRVDAYLATSARHVFAAGDVTGRVMLVPQALRDGFVAATNAVRGPTTPVVDVVSPIGSFTDPEYAQAGLTEPQARERHDVSVAVVHFDATTRTIIDGRPTGFCKLVVDRTTHHYTFRLQSLLYVFA
jgi:hypothetical protein